MTIHQLKQQKIINECDKHILRMNSAYRKIAATLPLDKNKYINLSEDEIEHIDQYLFRFAKLQDAIGKRFFKVIAMSLEEDLEDAPFIDLLNRLEKLNVLDSVEQWLALRKIRNVLSHTYDDEPEEMSMAINDIFDKKQTIEKIYQQLIGYSRRPRVSSNIPTIML